MAATSFVTLEQLPDDVVAMAATSLVTLEELPDDVLVMALKYVDVEDILACRLVSKRFCGLALHRDVWRHRKLADCNPRAGAVLRLAPCLYMLKVTGRIPTLAATTTGCAVAKLMLMPSELSVAANAAEYSLVVRNQESLGRLRELVLYPSEMNEADVLYRTVASCSGLASLSLSAYFMQPQITQPIVSGPPRSSLTYFTCSVDENSASFVNTILAGHSATLEAVEIPQSDLQESTTAELLAAMPRLRKLLCDSVLCGLEAVAECKALRDVHIFVDMSLGDYDRAIQFLRRADQLRRVYLETETETETDKWSTVESTVLTDAIEALASSGRSRVEQLFLEARGVILPLLRSLPSLPALRFLNLALDFDVELLKSITPVTAPALRLLEIVAERGKCPHAWIHGAAVKATLTGNPLLHIQLWSRTGRGSNPQDCETCAAACHQGVNWHGVWKIGLYSHDPGTCPSPEAHADVTDWELCYKKRSTKNAACTWIRV
ncbi:uncharacterized protein LOC127749582 [Frankliniella occidentalis]|uniref:Uncharacterized protein LOC127749582 n=1 Tax=Frankliniella occidentalis TaxID=133901 RepID=A0A9C6U7B3_FRAOC|nr:uncharacterized protein LOC127749582 [Frankliniella occidentalis]